MRKGFVHLLFVYFELGIPGVPGGAGILGAPGAAGAPGIPGAPGMLGLVGRFAPQEGQTISEASALAPHFGHVFSISTAAGLKHIVVPFLRSENLMRL